MALPCFVSFYTFLCLKVMRDNIVFSICSSSPASLPLANTERRLYSNMLLTLAGWHLNSVGFSCFLLQNYYVYFCLCSRILTAASFLHAFITSNKGFILFSSLSLNGQVCASVTLLHIKDIKRHFPLFQPLLTSIT